MGIGGDLNKSRSDAYAASFCSYMSSRTVLTRMFWASVNDMMRQVRFNIWFGRKTDHDVDKAHVWAPFDLALAV
jgi:hypothetical protein